MGNQEYELMMQALVTLVREFTNVYERLRTFTNDVFANERLRAFASVDECLRAFASVDECLRTIASVCECL